MKKLLALLTILCLLLAFTGCNGNTPASPEATEKPASTEAPTAEPTQAPEPEVPVMSHAEYVAAELDTAVTVETYVQAKQSWWDDKANVYAQSQDGAYFIYEMACSEADFAKLVPGTKIRVSGYKSEWSGEVEIIDATFEILEGSYIASPLDATALLGSDSLIDHQNERVSFRGLTVAPSTDADGNEAAFLYKWNGTGADGDDLYFNVSYGGKTYSFTVESYLCGPDTEVYQAVKALRIGDTVDLEGFLYWYEGVNPHITDLTVVAQAAMTHAEYIAADMDTPVVVETYVQAKQSWWDDQVTVYAQSEDGAYFLYNMACTEADYAKLVPGTKIRVSGYKSEWSGEVEIIDATFEILPGSYIAAALDVTDLLGDESLIDHQNERIRFSGLTIAPSTDADGNQAAFLYKWNGTGSEGDDLYFNVYVGNKTFTFTVESYLCGPDTEVYQAVKNLRIGDTVDLEGFLYWYVDVNAHITDVTVVAAADNELLGSYLLTHIYGWTVEEYADLAGISLNEAHRAIWIELKADGQADCYEDGELTVLDWRTEGDRFILGDGENTLEGTLVDGIIVLDVEGEYIVLTRSDLIPAEVSTVDAPAPGVYYMSRVSTWTVQEYAELAEISVEEAQQYIWLELAEDGTGRFYSEDESADILWRMEDGRLILSTEDENDGTLEGVVLGSTIRFDFGGDILELTLAGPTEEELAGTYFFSGYDGMTAQEYADEVGLSLEEAREAVQVTIYAEGQAQLIDGDETAEALWTLEGDKIAFTFDDGTDPLEATVGNGTLTFVLDDGTILVLAKD